MIARMATASPDTHAGRMVRNRRESLGLSRQKVAVAVGCNQNSILKAEGRRDWSMLRVWFALRICTELGLDLATVVAAGEGERPELAEVSA